MLSAAEGCRETIIVNGRQITLQANTTTEVDLLEAPP
jgi:hypothetical protein